MSTLEEPCPTPQRSLLDSIKKLFWAMQTTHLDGPGIAAKSPAKLPNSMSLAPPQSPITSATPQRRSAAVESARRKIMLASPPPALKFQPEETGSTSDCHDSEEDVLFSPATWRHDDEEHSEGGNGSDSEGSHKHSIHKVSDDESEPDFCPYRFIKSLPLVDTLAMSRPPVLPIKDKKYEERMTLVLDLDETLVHCSVDPIEHSELTFPVVHCGQEYQVHVRRRPFFKEFCEKVSEWFEVVIFTASQRVYADRLLDILDPNGEYFQHRLFRDHCHFHEGNYLKDLRVLNRDLRKVAIIDNSVQAFGLHLDNGIPVESWFDEDNDSELMRLIPFLDQIRDASDVRPHIRRQFRLKELVSNL